MKTQPTRGFGIFENFLAAKRAQMAEKLIPGHLREGRILDIGCGLTPVFLKTTRFKYKYGVDARVSAGGGGIEISKLDVSSLKLLPFEDGFFEVITMLAVIEHIKQDRIPDLFAELFRILKPGGVFILTTPCPWSDPILKILALLRLVSPEEMAEHKETYYTKQIAEYLKKNAFRKDNIKEGYFLFGLNSFVVVQK